MAARSLFSPAPALPVTGDPAASTDTLPPLCPGAAICALSTSGDDSYPAIEAAFASTCLLSLFSDFGGGGGVFGSGGTSLDGCEKADPRVRGIGPGLLMLRRRDLLLLWLRVVLLARDVPSG